MLRFGSVKSGKTAFSLLAVALALQYLCIRYAALGNLRASSHSARLAISLYKICCTREIESRLSFLSFAISLYKIS